MTTLLQNEKLIPALLTNLNQVMVLPLLQITTTKLQQITTTKLPLKLLNQHTSLKRFPPRHPQQVAMEHQVVRLLSQRMKPSVKHVTSVAIHSVKDVTSVAIQDVTEEDKITEIMDAEVVNVEDVKDDDSGDRCCPTCLNKSK